jgi:hypothetical protein
MKLIDPHKIPHEVTCIICIYKGFIVGYKKNGRIQIYHESKDNKRIPYTLTKALDIKNGDDIEDVMIRDMSVSPSAD